MAFKFRIRTLVSSAGETITLPSAGVTCIVGGNNEGKSQLLRDIKVHSSGTVSSLKTLASATFDISDIDTDEQSLLTWLRKNTRTTRADNGEELYTPYSGGTSFNLFSLKHHIRNVGLAGDGFQNGQNDFFVRLIKAGALTAYAAGTAVRNSPDSAQPLMEPIRDGGVERALSDLAASVFGQKLILDRNIYDTRIRVGTVSVPVPFQNNPNPEYSDAVTALPTLNEQGDGMKSFIGLALVVLAERPNVLLVDEPEAFLHPAQSRALGRWLSEESVARNIQIILSTHDRDIVLGVLDSAPKKTVNIVRITRDDRVNHLFQLTPADVESIWEDPVLRYSNVMQGLFHKRVAICESDSDCRFFGAALDQLGSTTGRRSVSDEVLFVPAGGKDGIAPIAAALRKLGVESRAIADFDALFDKRKLKRTLESIGGIYSTPIETAHRTVLDELNANHVSSGQLKKHGLGLLTGSVLVAAETLLELLADHGMYVTPSGEMEGFDRRIPSEKAAWVSAALAKGVHTSHPVQHFVSPILQTLSVGVNSDHDG